MDNERTATPGTHTLVILHNDYPSIESLVSELTDSFIVYSIHVGNNVTMALSGFPLPDLFLLYCNNKDEYEILVSLSLKDEYKAIPVIVLSSGTSIEEHLQLFAQGAVDCVSIPFNIDVLKAKMASLIRFKMFCLECSSMLIETEIMKSLDNLDNGRYKKSSEENMYLRYGITLREREIIELLCRGLLNKEISDTLNVSKRTVEFHINNIYHKFNVNNRMELLKKIK